MAFPQLPQIETINPQAFTQNYMGAQERRKRLDEYGKQAERQSEEYEYGKSQRPMEEETNRLRLNELKRKSDEEQQDRILNKQKEVQTKFWNWVGATDPNDLSSKEKIFNVMQDDVESLYPDGKIPPQIAERMRKTWDNLDADTISSIQQTMKTTKPGEKVWVTTKDGYEVELPFRSKEFNELVNIQGAKLGKKATQKMQSVPRGGTVIDPETGKQIYQDTREPAPRQTAPQPTELEKLMALRDRLPEDSQDRSMVEEKIKNLGMTKDTREAQMAAEQEMQMRAQEMAEQIIPDPVGPNMLRPSATRKMERDRAMLSNALLEAMQKGESTDKVIKEFTGGTGGGQAPGKVPAGTKLDRDTAAEILREAQDDKEAARKIAKDRGYSF